MFIPILGIVSFFAILLIIAIMYLTREGAGHNIRHDVREAALPPQTDDPKRGIRS